MNSTVLIIIGILALVIITAVASTYYFKRRNMTKFFAQIQMHIRQVPKGKRNSFVLLMITQALSGSSKKARAALATNMNNQKYVEIQLLQMTKILKNASGSHDKRTKQALNIFKKYMAWDELMRSNKAS